MKSATILSCAALLLTPAAVFAADDGKKEEKAVDPKKVFEETKKDAGSKLDPTGTKTVSKAVTEYIEMYPEHPAADIVRLGAPFIFTDKMDILMDKIFETALPKKEEKKEGEEKKDGEKKGDKKKGDDKMKTYHGLLKSIKAAQSFANIVIEELSESPKLPEGNKKSDKAIEATDEYLKDLVTDAKALKEKCDEKMKPENIEKYDTAAAKELARDTVLLVLKVLKLNNDVETFGFLIARIITQLAIASNSVMTLNKHKKLVDVHKKDDEADKKDAEEIAKILGDLKNAANKISCEIRPLTKTMVFRVVLAFTLFMAVVLGIVTVVMSKKAESKQH